MGLGAEDEKAAFDALGGVNPVHWQVGTDTRIRDADTVGRIGAVRDEVGGRQRELEFSRNASPEVLLWEEAPSAYSGYASPREGMLERLGAGVSDEDQEAFRRNKGRSTELYNDMKAKYPLVPEAVLASPSAAPSRDVATWSRDRPSTCSVSGG